MRKRDLGLLSTDGDRETVVIIDYNCTMYARKIDGDFHLSPKAADDLATNLKHATEHYHSPLYQWALRKTGKA